MYLQRIRFGAAVQVAPILRIPPRSSCNRIEARRTTRTRRVHPASSWHQSRTGMSQSCAPKHPSNLAHSDVRCASGWAHSRLELERPLPADLCGLRSQQAAGSLRCACGIHAGSWRLLDCSWKAAAGGTSVRYHRDRAIPTTTAAQNGLLGQRHGMRLESGPWACTQSTFGLLCCATASVSARECPIGCASGLLLCRQPENLSVRLISRRFRCEGGAPHQRAPLHSPGLLPQRDFISKSCRGGLLGFFL